MSLNRLENPTGGWLNWSGNGQSRSTPEAEKKRTTYGTEVDDGAMGDGTVDFGEKAERRLSTTIDPPSRAGAGRISLKNEPAVPKWCVDEESRHRRTTAIPLATRDAPAHTRATIPAARDGESAGGRMVRRAVVVPSTTAAWRCFPSR